ncbi:MFS transporter [Bacillus nakamurai]|uniref:MFS transporter n=1 Tax=Bacillus nakamurai TaxID=1793963 RepID=A0A150F9S0_9BACI|nr:MFS transporter [Bacillus nakamurai]KXZ21769.1 MFS transporter [Bacillus nakamurai]MED1226647.1 MFS transporter [Bacillus nakamurai]
MKNTWKVYILAIISFLVGTSEYVISGVLDRIADSLGITLAAAGQLITIFSFVYAIGTPVMMALTARLDRKKLIMYALGVFIFGNLCSFILPGYGLFVAARVIMAIGAGMVVVTALNIAAKIAPPGKQASSLAMVIMGFTAALIIGVPIGRVVSEAFGWRSVFGGIAALGIIAIIILFFTLPQTKGDKPVPLVQQFSLLKKRKVAVGLAITFFWLGGYSVAYTYLSPYLLNVSHISSRMLSTLLFIFGVASLIGSKLGGFSADRWGARVTLTGGMALHTLMLILLSLVTHSVPGVAALLTVWSFAAWSSGPAQQYHLATMEPESSGVLLGLNQSMMQLAMAAGAGIGGIAVTQLSLASVTWIGAGGMMIAMCAVLSLSPLRTKKHCSEISAE